jgi:hypothetical protein
MSTMLRHKNCTAVVAQLVEHLITDLKVKGSIPGPEENREKISGKNEGNPKCNHFSDWFEQGILPEGEGGVQMTSSLR